MANYVVRSVSYLLLPVTAAVLQCVSGADLYVQRSLFWLIFSSRLRCGHRYLKAIFLMLLPIVEAEEDVSRRLRYRVTAKIDLRYIDFDGLSAVQLKTAARATAYFSIMINALVTILAVLLLLLVLIVWVCTCASTFPCSCASSFLPFFRFCFGAQSSSWTR